MQFGGKMNMGNLGQGATTQMVKLAYDRGINLVDTADVYSLRESETLLGNALKGIRREIVLATKVRLPMAANFNWSGATRVNILREIEDSLKRLQTDCIDLYQVHGWDSSTPLEETVRTLDDLVRHGKVRYLGLSNLMSWQASNHSPNTTTSLNASPVLSSGSCTLGIAKPPHATTGVSLSNSRRLMLLNFR